MLDEIRNHFLKYNYDILDVQEINDLKEDHKFKKYLLKNNLIHEMNDPDIVKILKKINQGGGLINLSVSIEKFICSITKEGLLYELEFDDLDEENALKLYFELKSCFMNFKFEKNFKITVSRLN